MQARCQCGRVTFKTPLDQPLALYICHCDECKRQTSSAFGTSAIFPCFPLPDAELLSVYSRPTASGHTLNCYFCRICGVRLIHMIPGKNVLSVKGGCLQGLDWSRAIHIWTKSAMVPIPESAERFAEEPNFPAPGPGASPSNTATTATTPAADTPASAPSPAAGAANVNDPGYAVSQEMLDQPSGLEGSGGWKDEDGLRDSDLGYHYHDDRPVVGGVAEGGGVSGACELSGR